MKKTQVIVGMAIGVLGFSAAALAGSSATRPPKKTPSTALTTQGKKETARTNTPQPATAEPVKAPGAIPEGPIGKKYIKGINEGPIGAKGKN